MAAGDVDLQNDLIELSLGAIEDLKLSERHNDSHNTSQSSVADETDDDIGNEFLNSSSFLSNSQIIRTSNLKNTITANISIQSPTRPNGEPSNKNLKNHFKISVGKQVSDLTLDSDNDRDGNEISEDDASVIGDSVRKSPNSPLNSSKRNQSSTLKYIDIDDPDSTPKLPKMRPETTPWRKLRPISTFIPTSDQGRSSQGYSTGPLSTNFIGSILDDKGDDYSSPARSASLFENNSAAHSDGASSTTAHSIHEIENLRKQITNYKLQQKLLTELIRSIIKSSGNGDDIKHEIIARLERENSNLTSQKFSLQNDLKGKSDGNSTVIDEEKYNEKIREVLELKDDLISTKKLNDELSSYIDELKSQMEVDNETLSSLNNQTSAWEQLADDVLSLLLNTLDGDSVTAILQARDQSNSITTKLKVISLALNEILEAYETLKRSFENLPDPLSLKHTDHKVDEKIAIPRGLRSEFQQKIEISKEIENDLKTLVAQQSNSFTSLKSEYESLKLKFKENANYLSSVKKCLEEKSIEITSLNDQIIDLQTELDIISKNEQTDDQTHEVQLLKNRLKLAKLNHSKEIAGYEQQVEDLKEYLVKQRGQNQDKRLTEELLKKEKELAHMNAEVESLNHRVMLNSKSNDSTIYELENLLHDARDELDNSLRESNKLQQLLKAAEDDIKMNDRNYKITLDNAAKELNNAVTKQRTLLAEKSKLTFALEDIKREKNNLTLNNATLNEKVARLGYQVSTLSTYELGFSSLYQLQVAYLKNLLSSFNDVLEESSILQAEQKLKKLFDPSLEFDQIHSILRSLFAYFENATSSLIEDHAELLLRYNEGDINDNHSVDQLKDEIDKLTEELQWWYNNANPSIESDQSFRTKLRLEDLEKKRKAERERRKQDHEAYIHKINRLEKENLQLKEKLNKLQK